MSFFKRLYRKMVHMIHMVHIFAAWRSASIAYTYK